MKQKESTATAQHAHQAKASEQSGGWFWYDGEVINHEACVGYIWIGDDQIHAGCGGGEVKAHCFPVCRQRCDGEITNSTCGRKRGIDKNIEISFKTFG